MEPAHLYLGRVQSGLIDERFPGSQVGLQGSEQGLLQEDPIEAPAPPKFNRLFDHLTEDAHGGVMSPTPGIVTTVLEDGFGEGNLPVLEAGQMPHHRSRKTVESITDEGSSLE